MRACRLSLGGAWRLAVEVLALNPTGSRTDWEASLAGGRTCGLSDWEEGAIYRVSCICLLLLKQKCVCDYFYFNLED